MQGGMIGKHITRKWTQETHRSITHPDSMFTCLLPPAGLGMHLSHPLCSHLR